MKNLGNWNDYTTKIITDYLTETGSDESSVARVINGFKMGRRFERIPENTLQQPDFFCPGLRSQPWYNPAELAWTKILEDSADIIINSYNKIAKMPLTPHPENDKLANNGNWNSLFFYRTGQRFNENFINCPELGKLIDRIEGTDSAGSVYFARLTAGAKIVPHYGPHNYRLRAHMGIKVPKDTFIEVGEIRKTWEVGKCIVFDDSFLHFVENNSTEERIVFILDVWHPDLKIAEIKFIKYIMKILLNSVKEGNAFEGAPSSILDFM